MLPSPEPAPVALKQPCPRIRQASEASRRIPPGVPSLLIQFEWLCDFLEKRGPRDLTEGLELGLGFARESTVSVSREASQVGKTLRCSRTGAVYRVLS